MGYKSSHMSICIRESLTGGAANHYIYASKTSAQRSEIISNHIFDEHKFFPGIWYVVAICFPGILFNFRSSYQLKMPSLLKAKTKTTSSCK